MHIMETEDKEIPKVLETLDCREQLTDDDIKSLHVFVRNLKYRAGHAAGTIEQAQEKQPSLPDRVWELKSAEFADL